MAAARRIYTLIVDVSTGHVVDRSGRVWIAEDIILMRGDNCVFQLELIKSIGDQAAFAISSGCTFKFGIKDPASITGSTYLAYADDDAFNITADWDQWSLANGKICVVFDTNTTNINTFLSGKGNSPQDAVAEIQITFPGQTPFTPAHFDIQIRNDVIRGDEGDPLPSTPTYLTAAEVNARLGSGIQFVRKGANQVALLLDGNELETFGDP